MLNKAKDMYKILTAHSNTQPIWSLVISNCYRKIGKNFINPKIWNLL